MDWRAALREDLIRNTDTGRVTVVLFRLSQATMQPDRSVALRLLTPALRALKYLWVELVIGAELPRSVECGPGLRLPHGGRGVVLHPTVRLGRDVTLFHRTTLGIREVLDDGNIPLAGHASGPVLGDGVYVGTGAAILGPIEIGARSKIGAGAVVLQSIEPGTTVVGIPAHAR